MSEQAISNHRSAAVESASPARRVSPPVDIYENAEGFLIVADLPGVAPDALKVEFNPPELHVQGRLSAAQGPETLYERRFELGRSVDPAGIQAHLEHGVLRIELKKAAALRPRRIEVRSA
ncbi:MAG TPA: Hsp20/alpha crystallin family protein [Polyangiaceae bacterium]|nr:Hsp20/alpha crystallin family protein [Polyangiaceae bacterium]